MGAEPSALMKAMAAESGTITGVDVDAEQLDLLRDDEGKLPHDIFRRMRENAERGVGRPAGSGNKRTAVLAKLIVHKFGDPVEALASIYAMPLDQLCELLVIADGSRKREERLAESLGELREVIRGALAKRGTLSEAQTDQLTTLLDRVESGFRVLKVKPGELALKAMIAQRDAAREVAQYVHSKMPVAVDVTMRPDVILNIPGLTDAASLSEFANAPELTQEALEALEYTPFEPVPDESEEREPAPDDEWEGGE
jgi:hypothetical protein